MPFDATTLPNYIDQLLVDSLPADQREAIKKAVTSETAIKRANELAVPRPDYSSSLDTQRSKFDEERSTWNREKEDYRVWFERQKQRISEWEASHGGNPNNAVETQNPNVMRQENGQFVTRQDLDRLKDEWQSEVEKRFTSHGEAVLGVTEDYVNLVADYQSRFGKQLNVAAVRELAIKEGTNLRIAYDRHIAPELKKQQEEDFEKKLAAAREEGRLEGASRAHNPANPGSIDGHPVFGRRSLPPDYSKMTSEQKQAASEAAFEKSWSETQGFNRPT